MSFGVKHGLPNDADFVFDARSLPNPFYVPELKHKTGQDKEVRDFVMCSEDSAAFYDSVRKLVELSLELANKEGRSQLIFAVGCTGGHHRSVTIAELLFNDLREKYSASVSHRDILK